MCKKKSSEMKELWMRFVTAQRCSPADSPLISNAVRMCNAWCSLYLQALALAWEAQGVMALRFVRIASAGAAGRRSEAYRMVTEKIAALAEAQAASARASIGGGGHRAARRVLGVYQRRVRHNKRRLTRRLAHK
jgi:hypothetical protein